MPNNSSRESLSVLRVLMEKYNRGQRELHHVFVDLEKAKEELWYCMRTSGVEQTNVRLVHDMYDDSETVGEVYFKVGVG